MSEFSALLARREIPSSPPAGSAPSVPPAAVTVRQARRLRPRRRRGTSDGTLAAASAGSRVVVAGVGGDLDPAAARRLIDLGFAPGAAFEVLRRAPLGDPTVFRVADTEIALRRRHAAGIRIEAPTGTPGL